MEGKKYRALGEDCQAVSEVVGQVLMIAIVVLAFSSVAVVIFSDLVVNPPHTPHTDLQANLQNTSNKNIYTLYIFHTGGEVIDLNDTIVYLSASGEQKPIPDLWNYSWDSKGNKLKNGTLMFGDYIIKKELEIPNNGTVDMYFVYMPSQQVIQKFTFYV